MKWSVTEPARMQDYENHAKQCRAQTVPIFMCKEACPDGSYVRAITDDGRELWRRKFGGPMAPIAPGLEGKEETQPAEHINLSTRSLCDEISSGMTKDGVSRLAQDRNLRLGEKERQSNSWVFEEHNFRCTILFGEAGTVVKNKKIIITD